MPFESTKVAETFGTLFTAEASLTGVHKLMSGQVVSAHKAPPAQFTRVQPGFVTTVFGILVTSQVGAPVKALVASRTLEFLLLGVGHLVHHEVLESSERLVALFTRVALFFGVGQCVPVVVGLMGGAVVAI